MFKTSNKIILFHFFIYLTLDLSHSYEKLCFFLKALYLGETTVARP